MDATVGGSYAGEVSSIHDRMTKPADPKAPPPIAAVSFLGLPLAACTTEAFIDWVSGAASTRARALVGYLNAANVNIAFEDRDAAERFREFDCLYADGQAVVWGARRLSNPVPERVNAGDFIENFFRRCADLKLSIALIGGAEGDAAGFANHFQQRIPNLKITFIHQGYFSESDADAIARQIEDADPAVVLLGMGTPRQERLALSWSRAANPRVWWCVGALFEYYSGRRARAPVWMRRAGLEWLFRLALEPGRLWRRYLIGNPKFVYRVLRGSPVISSSAALPPSGGASGPSASSSTNSGGTSSPGSAADAAE